MTNTSTHAELYRCIALTFEARGEWKEACQWWRAADTAAYVGSQEQARRARKERMI